MNWSVVIANIMSGGFLKGKRTALLGVAALVTVFVNYATGDIGLADFIMQSKTEVLVILGLFTAAASGNT